MDKLALQRARQAFETAKPYTRWLALSGCEQAIDAENKAFNLAIAAGVPVIDDEFNHATDKERVNTMLNRIDALLKIEDLKNA